MGRKKKYLIITFGCQMNVLDSERMEGFLRELGWEEASDIQQAHLILINTCTVREKPERKALSLLGRLCKKKSSSLYPIVGICGCVAQQYGEELLVRFSGLNFVLGTNQVYRLKEALEKAEKGERFAFTDWLEAKESSCLFTTSRYRPVKGVSAFVTIMEGCDNFCAYCIVPYVRGRERSRDPKDIISEIEWLAEQGVKEVVLLGQNVNSYGLKNGFGVDFPELLKMVCGVEGIKRVRFTTNHPKDLSDKLIEVMAEEEKICEQIHLPLQAGSNKILKLMGRGYTREKYLELVEKLRKAMPEVGISTDLIVGFPGESEEDFKQTLEMVKLVEFDEAFTFKYTPRPFTRARTYPEQVPEEIKRERLYQLEELVERITEEKNQKQVGKSKEILLEGESKKDPERLTGRSREGRLVHIPKQGAEKLIGEIIEVKIIEGLKHSLIGELLETKTENIWQGEEQCLLR